jgi:thiol-disulfide isomerase/thioredoxin
MISNLLLAAAMLAASVATPIESLAQERPMQTMTMRAHPLPIEGTLPSLTGATTWLNSQPLTPEALRGKVVVVDFWTFTCINWQRTEPYVRAWAEKYKDQGLVVIGVHTPEFEFEKNVENIRPALKRFRIEYPVAVDSDYGIWNAFGNQYWPAVYVVDANGRIRHHQFGEGEYERTEAVIQQLLREAGYSGMGNDAAQVDARGSEIAADWVTLRSQENYLGHDRTQGFASPGGPLVGKTRSYAAPGSLRLNQWALSGDWTVNAGAVALDRASGRVVYRFHARDLHLVMGPSSPGSSARFRVLLDGRPPGDAHGTDVDEQGYGTVKEERLYQLIRQPQPIADRLFEIEFLDPGVKAYVFTFG